MPAAKSCLIATSFADPHIKAMRRVGARKWQRNKGPQPEIADSGWGQPRWAYQRPEAPLMTTIGQLLASLYGASVGSALDMAPRLAPNRASTWAVAPGLAAARQDPIMPPALPCFCAAPGVISTHSHVRTHRFVRHTTILACHRPRHPAPGTAAYLYLACCNLLTAGPTQGLHLESACTAPMLLDPEGMMASRAPQWRQRLESDLRNSTEHPALRII
ncbi:uncharacterized protein B0I36DRAFT_353270 [Microdochium trichocladiopsis]|uniref:Uncharacterized protein n=1 Tax=Microdochium trichocladiopsis TaxID=1682393 RepID=A0A9P9BLP2_9PEZI|nr:uncharacterized protein B0I36DRAFT_353270 [Microdochium trichocladiopsis]KAH7025107.1 hypothetical protein B0I36DRAFT_353270 [Microdochium trichocladiopsis]